MFDKNISNLRTARFQTLCNILNFVWTISSRDVLIKCVRLDKIDTIYKIDKIDKIDKNRSKYLNLAKGL